MEDLKKLASGPAIPLSERPPACPSCPFKGIKVGTRGPIDSPFVIVGEAPGSNEIAKGYPFAGMGGQMLQETLAAVGLPEDGSLDPFYVNALQCLPRDKDKPGVMAHAAKCCQGRLAEQLRAYPRKIILTLGNSAAWSVTDNFNIKITMDRGKRYPHPAASAGVVSTFHPAFLMRNGQMYPQWKADLKYAVELLKDKDPKAGLWEEPTWSTVGSREEYESLVTRMDRAAFIAGDIETGGPAGAGLHFQKGYIIGLGITSDLSDGNHVEWIPGDLIWNNEDLSHRLLGNKAEWIWQNGKFDIKFFRYEGIHEARVDHDTMLLSYTLNENKGHDLDTIAWDWVGAPQHKKVVEEWFTSQRIARKNRDYGKIPRDLLIQYAAFDISKTYKMFWALWKAVQADPHSHKLYTQVLIPASEFLTRVEMKGLLLDLKRVHENDAYLAEQLIAPAEEIQKYAHQYTGGPINIDSPMQLSKLLYNHMKLGPIGGSTDDDALIRIQRRFDHPIVNHIMRWRKVSKARNTYVKNAPNWPGLDGRVHTSFKMHATTTGRLSSSDPTNIQNWPRDAQIRGEFIATPGRLFAECDLNQAELRCLAIMSNDPTLIDIYTRNEVSIHHITSVAMFGEHYTDDQKMRAKAVNFGIVYGRTAPSLAEEFNISLREADEYIRIWLARYPEATKFIQSCRDAPAQLRTMITNFGRKKRWGVVSYDNGRNLSNEAANFPHQSTAHDITLLSGIECQPVIKYLWDGDFVNEIHDALYSELFANDIVYGPAIAYIQAVMEDMPKRWGITKVPFLAEAKIGPRWGAKRNAKEAGEKDEAKLNEYMTDFKPTDEHREIMKELVTKYYEKHKINGPRLYFDS